MERGGDLLERPKNLRATDRVDKKQIIRNFWNARPFGEGEYWPLEFWDDEVANSFAKFYVGKLGTDHPHYDISATLAAGIDEANATIPGSYAVYLELDKENSAAPLEERLSAVIFRGVDIDKGLDELSSPQG